MLKTLRTYWTTTLLGLLIVYFGYHAFTGDRGLLSTGERDQALLERQAELAALTRERVELETRARLLKDESVSADLLDERARALLGFADPRDYVIRVGP
ncbi:MAG: FtsB family cell division protein [Phenylobacterium sp.]